MNIAWGRGEIASSFRRTVASCTEASSRRSRAKTERLDGDNGGTSVMCASVSSV
jgi:hypothetical protein